MLRHLSLILKNSVRNKRRSILTILSIAASLCLLAMLMALYHAFYLSPASPNQALRLIVRNRVSLANPVPMSYRQRIEQVQGVRDVTIFQWFGGTYKDARDPANFFGRFAIDPEKLGIVYPEYKIPDEQRKAFFSERSACIVGRKTAERHSFKIGDKIVIVGDIFPVTLNLTVRGFYDAQTENENLFFHYTYLNESLPAEYKDVVSIFILRMERMEDAARIASQIDGMFRNAPMQTKTESEKAFQISFLAFLGNVKAFLLLVGGAVTFTILLVAGNTMAMSVRERVREVGILKTIGFTPSAILGLMMVEAVVISLIGCVVGLGLASALCAAIRQMPSTFADMSSITPTPAAAAVAMAVAVIIGLISSLIPAYGASRMSIMAALRFTD